MQTSAGCLLSLPEKLHASCDDCVEKWWLCLWRQRLSMALPPTRQALHPSRAKSSLCTNSHNFLQVDMDRGRSPSGSLRILMFWGDYRTSIDPDLVSPMEAVLVFACTTAAARTPCRCLLSSCCAVWLQQPRSAHSPCLELPRQRCSAHACAASVLLFHPAPPFPFHSAGFAVPPTGSGSPETLLRSSLPQLILQT